MLIAIKSLSYGVPCHAFSDYFQMSPAFARECCAEFDKAICAIYTKEYLRMPTKQDLINIEKLHFREHKFHGIYGSIDCMHTTWKNCPKGWQGSYKGKEGRPSIVLEAVCDYNLWFWNAFYGCPGTFNDINILRMSNLVTAFTNGSFQILEEAAGVVPYSIGNSTFSEMYLLSDGIYPKYSRFVKTIPDPHTVPQKMFAQWQEGARKDIERAFGVLQCQFQFMKNPMKLMSLSAIGDRVQTCLILHNMGVSDRVMGSIDVTYDPAFLGDYEAPISENMSLIVEQEKAEAHLDSSTNAIDNRWKNLTDEVQHKRLFEAILKIFEQE